MYVLLSLSTARMSLSLSHTIALLVYRILSSSHTFTPYISIARICLSLSHAIPLLVYRTYKSVLVARYCSPCLMTLMTRKAAVCDKDILRSIGKKIQQVFLGQNTHRKKAGSPILRRHIKKLANYSS